jgi:hypothetical protein
MLVGWEKLSALAGFYQLCSNKKGKLKNTIVLVYDEHRRLPVEYHALPLKYWYSYVKLCVGSVPSIHGFRMRFTAIWQTSK